jgi:hypothetical protein
MTFDPQWMLDFSNPPRIPVPICDHCKNTVAEPLEQTIIIGQTRHEFTFCDTLCRNRHFLNHPS